MLSAPASSFRAKALLAVALSWVAGYTNAVALVAAGQTVSHQTGNTTHLADELGRALLREPGAAAEAAYFAAVVGAFLAGAVASGAIIELARRAGRRSRYVLPLVVEAALLAVVLLLLVRHPTPRHGVPLVAVTTIMAFAMGLQNATITRVSGAVVRTTHLTGVVTDFGLELVAVAAAAARWARRPSTTRRRVVAAAVRHPSVQRLALLGTIFTSFAGGAVAGTAAFVRHGPAALLVPVLFLTALAAQQLRVAARAAR